MKCARNRYPCKRSSTATTAARTSPKDACIIPRHPDFDLYDNVGRDADQIRSAQYHLATRGDLKRWARRDAQTFRAAHPLPDQPWPTPDLTPYLDALTTAQTPAETEAVTDHFLDAVEPALRAVSDYLVAAARWRRENHGAAKGSPSNLLMTAASRALSVLALADEAGLSRLRAAYDPASAPATPTGGQPGASAGVPPVPPSPGTSPRR
ncbi:MULTISPECIES: hypothetical protein [Streptomyces]|uniref:Uncharacterized protein n=1 Tax=Streptomyces doudnae TaxID=3075536 RepID=A0ABD5EWM1_9ACTN|nr:MULTISPECIES: hypothetical protein [unclassified Streptomyces]MDT0438720.1 hypothetical protein [Streptomyces sp. DSM 41981]SCD27860.1 hypothetical protein GA0115242_10059 [Streptomyces sp. SolWspMP-5a-2]